MSSIHDIGPNWLGPLAFETGASHLESISPQGTMPVRGGVKPRPLNLQSSHSDDAADNQQPAFLHKRIFGLDREGKVHGRVADLPPVYSSKSSSRANLLAHDMPGLRGEKTTIGAMVDRIAALDPKNKKNWPDIRHHYQLFLRARVMGTNHHERAEDLKARKKIEGILQADSGLHTYCQDHLQNTPARAKLLQLHRAVGARIETPSLPLKTKSFFRRTLHTVVPAADPMHEIKKYNREREVIYRLPNDAAAQRMAKFYERHIPQRSERSLAEHQTRWEEKKAKCERKIERKVRNIQNDAMDKKIKFFMKDRCEDLQQAAHSLKNFAPQTQEKPVQVLDRTMHEASIGNYLSDRNKIAWEHYRIAQKKWQGSRANDVLITQAKMLQSEILNVLSDEKLDDDAVSAQYHRLCGKIDYQHMKDSDDRDRVERGAKLQRGVLKVQAMLQGINFADWTSSVLAAKF